MRSFFILSEDIQSKRFDRLSTGSVDPDNRKENKQKYIAYEKKKSEIIKIEAEDWHNNLTDDDIRALNAYFRSDSYVINNALRNEYQLDERLQKISDDLSAALNKIPNTEGTFNRSLFFYDDISKNNFMESLESGEINFKAFTSMSKGIYDENDDIRLIMHVKTGKDLSSLNDFEQEVLLDKNKKFKLLSKWGENGKIFYEVEEL